MCVEAFHSLATSPEKARHNVSEYEALIKKMEVWRADDLAFSLQRPSYGGLLASILDKAALEDDENPETLVFEDTAGTNRSGPKVKPVEDRKGVGQSQSLNSRDTKQS